MFKCNVMQCKTPKTFQRPQKPRQGDQLIHRRYTKSSPQKPNFSFRFGVRSKSGKIKPGRQRGATVAVGDDGAMADVWWCRSTTGIGYLKEFCTNYAIKQSSSLCPFPLCILVGNCLGLLWGIRELCFKGHDV